MLHGNRFNFSFSAILLAFVFTSLALGGCSTGRQTPPTLASIQVTPTNPSIALGSSEQFTAMGTFTDSSTQDLSKIVRWTSSDTTAVINYSSGLTTHHATGRAAINATTAAGLRTGALG